MSKTTKASSAAAEDPRCATVADELEAFRAIVTAAGLESLDPRTAGVAIARHIHDGRQLAARAHKIVAARELGLGGENVFTLIMDDYVKVMSNAGYLCKVMRNAGYPCADDLDA